MLRYATIRFPLFDHRRPAFVPCAVFFILAMLAMATPLRAEPDPDPWEGYNRWMFEFNDTSDRVFIRPIAQGYDKIMPEVGRIGVNNFFSNFYDFNGILNALLQGRIEDALNNTFRVVANSTVGIFGLFDVASKAGIPRYETDFGHTLSIWGVPRGNFVMLPFIGPATVRSASGMAVDAFASPTGQMFNDETYWGLRAFNLLDIRAGLLDAEQVMTGDRYVFFRDVYLQNRAVLESGGQVKDDFSEFDGGWDEEEF